MPEPSRRPAASSARPSPPGRAQRREMRRRQQRRRRHLGAGIMACAALLAIVGMGASWTGAGDEVADTMVAPSPTSTSPASPPAGTRSPTPPPPVLELSADFPTEGPGTFRYATTEGDVLGGSGTLKRFRLAIEENVEEDMDEFAAFVDDTFRGAQGWTAGGDYRFQRVPDGASYEMTIHLVTSATAGQMCATAGLNVLAPSLPEGGVSCHYDGRVVINLSRWRLSVPDYVDNEVPLEVYRQMVINHEVGHALGLGHEACPGDGEPAPVMQQQTISLDGCEAYAWPYLDGQRYSGEPVP